METTAPTPESPLSLAFGYRRLPENAVAAWGARMIYSRNRTGRGYVADLVYDRQSATGPNNLTNRIVSVYNSPEFQNDFRENLKDGMFGTPDSSEVFRYQFGDVHVIASPNASYGYLYISLYLTS